MIVDKEKLCPLQQIDIKKNSDLLIASWSYEP
jgi:hypothetical protein